MTNLSGCIKLYHIIRPQVQGPSSSSKQEERVVATRVQSRGSDGGVEEGDGGDGNDDGDGMS